MGSARLAAVVVLFGVMLSTAACGPGAAAFVEVKALEVPQELRSQVASEFPVFEALAAEGNTATDAGETEQDVEILLRHKASPFFLRVEYDRRFRQGSAPTPWVLNTVGRNGREEALDFRGQPDSRTVAFMEHFVREYPRGEMVMQSSGLSDGAGSHLLLEAWVYPRKGDGMHGGGHETTFDYDPATRVWSGR